MGFVFLKKAVSKESEAFRLAFETAPSFNNYSAALSPSTTSTISSIEVAASSAAKSASAT